MEPERAWTKPQNESRAQSPCFLFQQASCLSLSWLQALQL